MEVQIEAEMDAETEALIGAHYRGRDEVVFMQFLKNFMCMTAKAKLIN